MPTVTFTQNLQRHIAMPKCEVGGKTVRQALNQVFRKNPAARGYILDEHGAVRYHMVIFVNGIQIMDREHLSDRVTKSADIYVMQALSGG